MAWIMDQGRTHPSTGHCVSLRTHTAAEFTAGAVGFWTRDALQTAGAKLFVGMD